MILTCISKHVLSLVFAAVDRMGSEDVASSSSDDDRINRNRQASKWTRKELAVRLAWAAIWPLFRFSPRLMWGWRRWLLRLFGAQVGMNVHIYPSVNVFIPWNLSIGDWSSLGFETMIYNLGKVSIGKRVTISQRAHLCAGTHDHRDPLMPLIKSCITVEDDVWICADAFVGPDVTVQKSAVVGARAVVMRNVTSGSIVAGNPATIVSTR
jgi:putative colanic acid biosynthesis acetyltransferase WcaF